ncbi:MAG: DUF448 domain-containing protein [Candidatus Rokuibacteriota bacterium]|nr:MAG: DUF448 domain-containing protein [Candidatus Rokubacteria bacterium]
MDDGTRERGTTGRWRRPGVSASAIPWRTCIGCRKVKPQADLMRLVRGPDGRVEMDRRGPGRGAYVCTSEECIGRALKGGRLAQAFRKPCEAGESLTRWVPRR